MDRYELRRIDYSLTEDHQALQAAYKDFFKTHCSIETVRPQRSPGSTRACGNACAPWGRRPWRCRNPSAETGRHSST